MPVTRYILQLGSGDYTIELLVPNAQEVQEEYLRQKQVQADVPFPHWTKVWPAAIALCDFIYKHRRRFRKQQVLELAAGLGLPSLMAARYAQTVCCSDYLPEAVDIIEQSARHLQLTNFTTRLLDWNHLPPDLTADILLLSDINYDPEQFDQLYQVLLRFLQQGTLIILATPQRLMAKPFIEKLLPFCQEQHEVPAPENGQWTMATILLLKAHN